MCAEYGKIVSAKAIMEKFEVFPRVCKGYGFVLFEQAESAVAALAGLTEKGVEASYARVSTRCGAKQLSLSLCVCARALFPFLLPFLSLLLCPQPRCIRLILYVMVCWGVKCCFRQHPSSNNV